MIARLVCVRVDGSRVFDFATVEQAHEAAARVCSTGCVGVHSVVCAVGGQFDVTGPPPPPAVVAAARVCKKVDEPQYWSKPSIMNRPLRRRRPPSWVPPHQPTPKRQPTAELGGESHGCGTGDTTPDQCRQGHSLDNENVYIRPDGRRRCRECERVEDRRPRRMARHAELQRKRRHRRRAACP